MNIATAQKNSVNNIALAERLGGISATPQPPSLSRRARGLLNQMTAAANVEPILDHRYLVKGWLDRAAMSVVYGPANVGKSFFALDLAYHVAAAREWHGARVNGGAVLYVVAEGGNGFLNRVAALRDREGLPLWCLPTSLDLCRSDADAEAVCEVLTHLKQHHGEYALIVVDTLARAMGAGDENASPDMGAVVRNIDRLRAATGAHVMLIHHSGKDHAKGARGHSSLRAATDTEIELWKEGEAIHAEARKQRDMPCGRPFAYMLREVELGRDSDGDPVTTCVVEPCEAMKKAPSLGARQRQVLDALREYLLAHGRPNPGGTGWPERGSVQTVGRDDFLGFVSQQMTNESSKDRKKTARRALDALIERSIVGINEGQIWLIPTMGDSGDKGGQLTHLSPAGLDGGVGDKRGHTPLGVSPCPPRQPRSLLNGAEN